MADIPEAVADTNALIFHAAGDRRLGPRAARHFGAAEVGQALVHVPMGVVWEMCVLARGGRAKVRRPVSEFFESLFTNPAYQVCGLTLDQIYAAGEMGFTRDPFDALIVAAARTLNLPLLTRDADISASGVVRVIW